VSADPCTRRDDGPDVIGERDRRGVLPHFEELAEFAAARQAGGVDHLQRLEAQADELGSAGKSVAADIRALRGLIQLALE